VGFTVRIVRAVLGRVNRNRSVSLRAGLREVDCVPASGGLATMLYEEIQTGRVL